MSKQQQTVDKKTVYAFPSRFGSHSSMVIKTLEDTVICKDEFGEYETKASRLDDGTADPNRWDLNHRGVKVE